MSNFHHSFSAFCTSLSVSKNIRLVVWMLRRNPQKFLWVTRRQRPRTEIIYVGILSMLVYTKCRNRAGQCITEVKSWLLQTYPQQKHMQIQLKCTRYKAEKEHSTCVSCLVNWKHFQCKKYLNLTVRLDGISDGFQFGKANLVGDLSQPNLG